MTDPTPQPTPDNPQRPPSNPKPSGVWSGVAAVMGARLDAEQRLRLALLVQTASSRPLRSMWVARAWKFGCEAVRAA